MALDPAPVDVFDKRSLPTIGIPVDLVNLGRAGEIPLTAQALDVSKAIPNARYATIEHASHFSMFGICKPGAAEAAALEGVDEPICSDGSGLSHRTIHARLVDMVEEAIRASIARMAPQR